MSPDSAVSSLKRTPLYDTHVALGARMVPFGGWEMPVQYAGIIEEHTATRQAAGLFDVSHMGEFRVTGPEALAFVQRVVANDVARLAVGRVLYTQFPTPDGGTVDDLLVYALESGYLLVVNGANIDKDWAWLQAHMGDGVVLADESDDTALIALQGPRAEALLAPMFSGAAPLSSLKAFAWADGTIGRTPVKLSRTGYTGEDGFEIFCAPAEAAGLWQALMSAGAKPCGLGARDTLRLEAGLPLFGHELDAHISPIQAGYGWSVKLDKGEFIGRAALSAQARGEMASRVVGLRLEGRQIAREGYEVFAGERRVGQVLSGTFSPTLGAPIATALVETDALSAGTPLRVQIRTQQHPATIVPLPFYRRNS